jgi:uncharacterized phage-associated protein
MVHARDVAAYVEARLGSINRWKLHKLLYCAQGWSLAWERKRLFPEPIKAWRDGPVVSSLWGEREHGTGPSGDEKVLSREEMAVVDAVLDVYGGMSGERLRDLSHRELPWRMARAGADPSAKTNATITMRSLRDYFGVMGKPGERRISDAARRGIWTLLETPEDRIDELVVTDEEHSEAYERWVETGEDEPWGR